FDSMFGSRRGKDKDRESIRSRGRDKDGIHRTLESNHYAIRKPVIVIDRSTLHSYLSLL
ncbi:hypothetical protein Tcan_03804, partial [Toxocara canis]